MAGEGVGWVTCLPGQREQPGPGEEVGCLGQVTYLPGREEGWATPCEQINTCENIRTTYVVGKDVLCIINLVRIKVHYLFHRITTKTKLQHQLKRIIVE